MPTAAGYKDKLNFKSFSVDDNRSIRFDRGVLRKAEITPEGYLRAEAVFARDGILEYRTPDGRVRKELRTPESNKKALTGFGLRPVTVEHPPVLLDAQNARQYAVGMTDSTVYYDTGGFVRGVITVFDSEAVNLIRSGEKLEISAGYQCKVEPSSGEWKGDSYDAIQKDLEINHVCVTLRGRAGSDVRVYLDSAEGKDVAYQTNQDSSYFGKQKAMATVTTPEGVTYNDIPETFAAVSAQKFTELNTLKTYTDSLEQAAHRDNDRIQELQAQLDELKAERDRQMGRADELEESLFNADSLLEDLGYRKDSDAEYHLDTKKKSSKHEEDEDEDEDEFEDEDLEDLDEDDDMDEEDEEEYVEKKVVKKTKKKDALSELIEAWEEAEVLVPDIKKTNFDSSLDCDGVRRLVIQRLHPEKDLTTRSDTYVQATYDTIKDFQGRSPSGYYADNLEGLLDRAVSNDLRTPLNEAQEARSRMLANSWQDGMAMTKNK